MPIIKWEPFMPFEEFERELQDLMPVSGKQAFAPALDIYKKDGNLVIEAPMPSVDPKKLEVSVENDVLTIKGESQQKREIDDKNFYRKEVRHGAFFRSVPLPAKVVGDKAEATFEEGMLKITVPLASETRSNPIKIKIKSRN